MATQINTVDLLPDVFQTETNRQFLSATLDTLTQQPRQARVQGFIGQKYGYTVNSNDKYVVEPTTVRTDYQLDPSVVFLKTDTQEAVDFICYPGMINAIDNYDGITNNNQRLYENQFYSWDPFAAYDKLINYNQYFWLPYGPDAITITSEILSGRATYQVNKTATGYTFTGLEGSPNLNGTNPTIKLLRRGTYEFRVKQDTPFWFQGVDTADGQTLDTNENTRVINGMTNNGTSNGNIDWTVPAKDAQDTLVIGNTYSVDLLADGLKLEDINFQTQQYVIDNFGGIDGVVDLVGKTLMFYNNGQLASQVNMYTINITAGGVINLVANDPIFLDKTITVKYGNAYRNVNFYKDSTTFEVTRSPYDSSILDLLYYIDGVNPLFGGKVRVYESNDTNYILPDEEIIGQLSYTSPNGVTFVNGLKIKFDNKVSPASYRNNSYYVAGVGTGIQLLPVTNFVDVETSNKIYNYQPITPDYITIDRDSRDLNPWSRSNRWFHNDVLDTTIQFNGVVTTNPDNTQTRAVRPIIEFQGNLSLFNSGTTPLGGVTYFATAVTDAFRQVEGQTSAIVDGYPVAVGDTIVFSNDVNQLVRGKVYRVLAGPVINSQPTFALEPVPGVNVTTGSQVYVYGGERNIGLSFYYNADTTRWTRAQLKNSNNQPPYFDIFDTNGNSFGDQLYYPGSNFTGNELFSYTIGTGTSDPVLGFPLAYSSVNNIGDINFTVNYNNSTFNYSKTSTETGVVPINSGFVHYSPAAGLVVDRSGWVTAAGPSIQYQVFQITTDTSTQTVYTCDIPANTNIAWKPVQVYVGDVLQDPANFTVTITDTATVVTLNTAPIASTKVTILVYSDQVSANAYYTIPTNLQNNPFNVNPTTIDFGNIKSQYVSIFYNAPGVKGSVFGSNNLNNLPPLTSYGTAVIQNSASLVLPGIFTRKAGLNFFDALQYNSEEYIKYKTLLVDITSRGDYNIYQSADTILEDVITQIIAIKTNQSFFWSDMLFSGSPSSSNDYKFKVGITNPILDLTRVYNFTTANYYGLAVYLITDPNNAASTTQLIRGVDYTVSDVSPNLTVNLTIEAGWTIVIDEYNQTYGSYCPNTPTKVGLYPASIPAVILDTTYTIPTYFILGHDGSYNRLYGKYNPITKKLSDFRDIVLFEFEKRVYNNLKVTSYIPLRGDDVIPGEWRNTGYTNQEILDIYTPQFLNWVGQNRIDYKTQEYLKANEFTYNYNESTNKLTGTTLEQGYWRGIYRWLYDTDHPDSRPWEMLGFTIKPSWWEGYYGAAPYTSNNLLLWTDLSRGYVYNGGAPYIDPRRARPQLLQVLPVDENGKLLNPFQVIVGQYDQLTFKRSWVVGDQAPAESSYLKSSTWPFDLMRLLALTRPAKFFNLCVDVDRYRYNPNLNQYLYDNHYHLDPRVVQVYGNYVSKNSYLNWIVDYVAVDGTDGTAAVYQALQNVDVRLTYRMAGFTSKNNLKFLIEKATPNTQSSSLLVPDDNYAVLLYDNVPVDRITYSSVLIQRVRDGWTVYGNSQEKAYFKVAIPKVNGVYNNVTVGNTTVALTTDYYTDRTSIVPYGTLFYSVQGLSEFLQNYGRYLTSQGMVFANQYGGTVSNWDTMIQLYINWTNQSWQLGSTIALNPAADLLQIARQSLVVQPLTIHKQNFILNQNLIPIPQQNFVVERDNTVFTVKSLNNGDAIGYTNLNLSSIEHAIVFDNTTIFNDTLYSPPTGLRQPRFLLQGYKSAEWQGYVDAQGFILSQDNIKQWQPSVKYTKGQIVSYKSKYWIANEIIEPAADFVESLWTKTTSDKVKIGLLPNPSTVAYEAQYYYDTSRVNLENDTDQLAFSLIGFRPRDYLAAIDLSDTTQVNVYKAMISEKGTNLIANNFKNVQLTQGKLDYDVQEIWAIKNAEFGSVLNSNYVEVQLIESLLTANPSIIAFSSGAQVQNAQQTVLLSDLINYQYPPQTPDFLPVTPMPSEDGLPSAGYVKLDDAKITVFSRSQLNDATTNYTNLYRGDNLRIASDQGTWNIYAPQSIGTQVINITNNFNDSMVVNFANPHNLVANDTFAIINFDDAINRFYTVTKVVSLTSLIVSYPLNSTITTINGVGVAYKIIDQRVAQPSDLSQNRVNWSEFYSSLHWVDNAPDGG